MEMNLDNAEVCKFKDLELGDVFIIKGRNTAYTLIRNYTNDSICLPDLMSFSFFPPSEYRVLAENGIVVKCAAIHIFVNQYPL